MIRNDTLDHYSPNWECFITLLLSDEMESEREVARKGGTLGQKKFKLAGPCTALLSQKKKKMSR